MAEYQAYKLRSGSEFFGKIADVDEKIHPVPPTAGYEWTETNMFGFNIPEHNIDCLIYLWHHPVLKVTYGGVTIWKGFKMTHLEAEACDFRMAMPMPAEPTDATYPIGLTVRMIAPQREFHLTWQHVKEDSSFDLMLTAAMPPAVRHTGIRATAPGVSIAASLPPIFRRSPGWSARSRRISLSTSLASRARSAIRNGKATIRA